MDSFEKRCSFFYQQAAEKYSEYPGAELIQMSYRLLWLGEWLRLTHSWHQQFSPCSPREALEYALIKQHQWTPEIIQSMSDKDMSLALTDYWTAFAADPEWSSRQWDIEKQLDRLDDPYTGMDIWPKSTQANAIPA
ncbi:hypothetical protein [Pectobacterium carotovorum]|uniref:hypothetical protein n=1 Tax=Pectobacterium carotovorum TaxID=554 RepID=UPI00068D5006|nr:hypothetical protein [Pectobacterium carotovorum]